MAQSLKADAAWSPHEMVEDMGIGDDWEGNEDEMRNGEYVKVLVAE